MLKTVVKSVTLFCLSINVAFAAIAHSNTDLCIALTNYSNETVEFSGIVNAEDPRIIPPGATAVLTNDLAGSCFTSTNECYVYVVPANYSHNGDHIDHIARGTHIIYGGEGKHYIDQNAHVKCGS